MKKISYGVLAFVALIVLGLSHNTAYAAASVSIQSLSPGTTVLANTRVSFVVTPVGFTSPIYRVVDSFSASTLSANNIEPGGRLTWTPEKKDAGVHVITISVIDTDGNAASVVQTITVMPPPSISIDNVLPGKTIMPGTKLTFSTVATGFADVKFVIGDTFGGSTAGNNTIDTTGKFAWTPDQSQNGDHTITVYASDSAGHYSTANIVIRVGNGPTINVSNILPSGTVSPGQSVTFAVGALNFAPTGYSVTDAFSGVSSISNNNITLSGAFGWVPQNSDIGVHTVTVTGRVGAYGDTASTVVTLTVAGANGVVPAAPASTGATSTSGVDLAALQAKLALLQSQMSGKSSAPSSNSKFTGISQFNTYLKSGSSGEVVLNLQKMLKILGYLTVEPNSYFGPSTLAAVKKFQDAQGLDALGVVGPGTRTALNALLSTSVGAVVVTSSSTGYVFEHFMGLGDDDADVTELQKKLIALGFMTGEPTGFYGGVTETAVKKFQKANGLPETGYVNSIVRVALNK